MSTKTPKTSRKPVRDKSSSVGRLGFVHVVQFDHEARTEGVCNVSWYATRSKALWAEKKFLAAESEHPEVSNVRSYVRPLIVELETAVEGTLAVVDLVDEDTQRDLEAWAAERREMSS